MRPTLLVTTDTAQARLYLGEGEESRHLKDQQSPANGEMPDRGSVISGRIGEPIRHQDESEALNAQRLLGRVIELRSEIEQVEQSVWSEALKLAYYPARTPGRRQCEIFVRGLRTKLRELKEQGKTLRPTLLMRRVNAERTLDTIPIVKTPPPNSTPFNYYELSWIRRLLRLIGDEDVVNLDDLRVALPELAFRDNSVPRIIEFLRYLGVRVERWSNDKVTLCPILSMRLTTSQNLKQMR